MSPVPHIVLTECLPVSPTASEEPVRDTANYSVDEGPSQDWTGRQSFGRAPQQELRSQHCFEEDIEFKKQLALLLTELEVRVLSPLEAEELSKTMGEILQTLTISPHTEDISEVQLSDRPLLVYFKEEKTVKEAYRLLHSLLESSKPVPKPRIKTSSYLSQQSSLVKVLRRGIETGDRILTLQHNTEIKMIPVVNTTLESSGSTPSIDSLTEQSQSKTREDIRRDTYKRLNSLEETIRELENTLIEISGHPTSEPLYTDSFSKSSPVQITGSPTSETQKPPVPPKPSSLSPASIQVHCLHLLCRFLL